MNIYLSPISSVLTGFILVLGFIHYLVLIEFYYKNKDKLNNPEFDNEKEFEKDKLLESFFDKSEFLKTKDSQISKVFRNFLSEK